MNPIVDDDNHSSDNRQTGGLNMHDASSTDKRRGGRRRREETRPIETVGGELRVWRDQGTNEIAIEPPAFAPAEKCGLITLSARHARHLANSLLLFTAETEPSPPVTATGSHSQRGGPRGRSFDLKGFAHKTLKGTRVKEAEKTE
jgi:hypothetical protein